MKLKPPCCYSFFVLWKNFGLKNGCSVGHLQAAYFKQVKIHSLQDRFERRCPTLHATNKSFSHWMIGTLQSKPAMSMCYIISLLAMAALQASCEIILSGNHVLMCYERQPYSIS